MGKAPTDPGCDVCRHLPVVPLQQSGCGIAHCAACNRQLETPIPELTDEEFNERVDALFARIEVEA